VTLKSFELSVLDCLRGLYGGVAKLGWFTLRGFDLASYERDYSLYDGCDLNWIIPNKICALSAPNGSDATQHALKVFKLGKVRHLIKLNDDAHYDEGFFRKQGVDVHNFYFPDGSAPDLPLVERFLNLTSLNGDGFAVHCKAGLGRTGTLIACYILNKHGSAFGNDAKAVLGWLRICRPGSVIGLQQKWLVDNTDKIINI
jgi:cell division cycle 14